MDVKLYYIEGISRTDTPYFAVPGTQATLARQTAYFATKLVRTVSTSFYPPHYTNEIKFDTDDIDFDDTVNYLSLTFRNKIYYYFIDDIEYLNEGVIKLYVTMDTIQTYMFDIRIASGVIERKFINRWTNTNKINRNYIRENVSEGLFQQYDFTTVNVDPYKFLVVLKKTEEDGEKIATTIIHYNDSSGSSAGIPALTESASYSFIPMALATNGGAVVTDGGTTIAADAIYLSARRALGLAATKSWCVDAYICPFDCIDGLTFSPGKVYLDGDKFIVHDIGTSGQISANTYLIEGKVKRISSGPGSTANNVPYNEYTLVTKTVNAAFLFAKNNDVGIPFNSNYMPMLLDENYLMLTFGSYFANTTYPLYMLEDNNCYCHYYFMLNSGNRVYLINDQEHSIVDKYRVTVTDTNALGVMLKNSPWENYISSNRSRWVGAIGETALDIVSMGATSKARVGVIGNERIATNKVNKFEPIRNKKGQFTGKKRLVGSTTTGGGSRKVFGEIPGSGEDKSADVIGSMIGGIGGQFLKDVNAWCAPATVKTSGDYDSVYNKASTIFKALSKVNDYEQCAQYYHRNAYLINEYVNNIDDIFAYVFSRYYFNFLKMSLPEVHLVNVIEDQTTIDSIVERLESGVRLWNNNATVITYSEYTDPTARAINYSGTITLPYHIVQVFSGTATVVPGSGSGSAVVYVDSFTGSTITYHVAGGGDTGVRFTIKFAGVFTQTIPANNIGNFTYDNVEIDYLP